MLTRFQVMSIATAIERVQGGEMTISTSQLCDLIRASAQEMEYYHDNPLDALKMVESHLTDLGKKADALMGELQKLIRYMEHEPEDDPDREPPDDDDAWSGGFAKNH